MGVHDGHRDRVKKRYLETGLEGFSEVNVLELILFYAISRKDTNELAHALLDRFGSLNNVLNASVPQLCQVEGIGENTAILLNLFRQTEKVCKVKEKRPARITSASDAADFLRAIYVGETDEVVFLICMNSSRKVVCAKEVGRGCVNAVEFSMNRIVELALANHAVSVILSHNHPGGTNSPSREDIEVTSRLKKALEMFSIALDDHLIVSEAGVYSFAANSMI